MNATYLDEEWFRLFLKTRRFDDISRIRPVTGSQEAIFLRGDIEVPIIHYPNLETFNIDRKRTKLQILEDKIRNTEPNVHIKDLYLNKIEEKIAVLDMLQATREKDDHRFFELSNYIYGEITKEAVADILNVSYSVIEDMFHKHTHPEIVGAAERTLTVLESFARAYSVELTELGESLVLTKTPSRIYNAEQLKELFEEELGARKITDWSVEINECPTIRVNLPRRVIFIPRDRVVSNIIATSLVAHEIDVHIVRTVNGEKASLKLLSIGLDRYLRGEEGLAAYLEEQATGIHKTMSVSHLSLLAAMSVDGVERSFRDVFNIIKDILVLRDAVREREYSEKTLTRRAWKRTLRIMRGTTGMTPGTCFTRDIIYYEGYYRIKQMFQNEDSETKRVFVGKYDPLNQKHRATLDALGIR